MKTLAQPRFLAMSLLCAAGFALAGTAQASQLSTGQLRLDGSTARVGAVDPYTDGAGKGAPRDPYADGARALDSRNPFVDGARVDEARDRFTDGA